MKRPLHVISMAGLGDSIYQRPFVKELAREWDVYLANPWPQFYSDLGVRFVRHHLRLRTQDKNVAAQPEGTYVDLPGGLIRRQYLGYDLVEPEDNIFTGLERMCPLSEPLTLDLPPMGPSPVRSDKPIAVIRPVTERSEWLNQARNPEPKYVHAASRILRGNGFHVVSVADIQTGSEIARGPLPEADEEFVHGELDVAQLMALCRDAAVVVGGIGWILPVALVYGTPTILIAGGHGLINRPERLTDPRVPSDHVEWIMPSRFCMCSNMRHNCTKTIASFDRRFERALESTRTAVAA